MTRRFSPGRWAVGAAAVVLAGAGVALLSHPTEPGPFPPPAGWVQVPCEPWPGGKGPCYAPPQQLSPKPPACGLAGQMPCYTPPTATPSYLSLSR